MRKQLTFQVYRICAKETKGNFLYKVKEVTKEASLRYIVSSEHFMSEVYKRR